MLRLNVVDTPAQTFTVDLRGQIFQVAVKVNTRSNLCTADFFQQGVLVVAGVTLTAGGSVTEAYNFDGLENLFAIDLENLDSDPTGDTLGVSADIFSLEESEVPDGASV